MIDHIAQNAGETRAAGEHAQPYSDASAAILAPLREPLRRRAGAVVARLNAGTARLPRPKLLLESLTSAESQRLKDRQAQHLLALASAELTPESHREMAHRAGRVHAMAGLDREDLIDAYALLAAALQDETDAAVHRAALGVLMRRLTRDLALQMEAYRLLQDARHDVIASIARMTVEVRCYTDLIERVAGILGAHGEVAGCAVGRPDMRGLFQFEAVSDQRIGQYLRNADALIDVGAAGDESRRARQRPIIHSWREGEIDRVINFATDDRMTPFSAYARAAGLRSVATLPIRRATGEPKAILVLYGVLPGGFSGADQADFLSLVQTMLELVVCRIERLADTTTTTPFSVRQRLSGLVRSDSLQMHYQPILDLRTGTIGGVEALARLQDGDTLLAPGQFLPNLSDEDLLALFTGGLNQALRQRDEWLREGLDLGMSVNLPPAALTDPRYVEATRQALQRYGCAPARLTLEVLESEELPRGIRILDEIARFKSLGIELAQDDLGVGYSSLNRLRELPFDSFKIDRSIVRLDGRDSLDALRFIYQLTRLGHSLGMSVTVEGVEEEDLLEALVILDADRAQGYAIARPMPAQALAGWIRERRTLPRPTTPRGILGKLARLVIWEESVQLNTVVSREARALLCADVREADHGLHGGLHGGSHAGCRDCAFPMFCIDDEAILLESPCSVRAGSALADLALSAGMKSEAYLAARRELIARM
jgi:EAL domain-containing protein (putative c-di-GMP-specific phosphodiesterase class I)